MSGSGDKGRSQEGIEVILGGNDGILWALVPYEEGISEERIDKISTNYERA